MGRLRFTSWSGGRPEFEAIARSEDSHIRIVRSIRKEINEEWVTGR